MASTYYLALFATIASLTVAHAGVIPIPNGHHQYFTRNNNIKWTNCSIDKHPGRECTRFEVPLDWHDQVAGKVSLAVVRYPATKSPKLGTLFMNPGGPGGSGVESIQGGNGDQIMEESGGQYDVVSWDPRGVGKSTPHTSCFGTVEEQTVFWNGSFIFTGLEARGDFTSQTDLDKLYGQVDEVDDLLTRFGKQCVKSNPNSLQYVGTVATVRDMVAMHDALEGPGKAINYWGISYGTVLGMTFVNMFPDRVGRVVLDGVVDPTYWVNRPSYKVYEVDLESTDEAFKGFAAACAKAGHSRCAIAEHNSTEASITQWTRDLLDTAYDYRRATGPSAGLKSALIRSEIMQGLYAPETWSNLAQKLKSYSDFLSDPTSANAAEARRWASASVGHMDDKQKPSNESSVTKPSVNANQAITCADAQDSGNTTTKDVFDFMVKVTRDVSHMFGTSSPSFAGTYCHRWPVRAVERYTGPWNKKLSNPILVIGNKADPITPYINAKNVADTLGSSAILIEQNGFGHSSLAMRSNCTASALGQYFLHNKLPEKDIFCETNEELFPQKGMTRRTI